MTLLAFALSLLTFISFPSRLWNFDGVACAAALELGNPVFFFHSNHLLYGGLGYLFWKLISLATDLRALPALQLFTSLLGALGLAGLYSTLKSELSVRPALLLALTTGVTAVVWQWSVEAQVYALGFAALSGATWQIFQPNSPKKWMRVGVFHAGAVLGHLVHLLWVIPALYVLFKENPRGRARPLRQYLLALSTFFIPYALVIGGVILPGQKVDGWLKTWIMGSTVLNAEQAFRWHFSGFEGPWLWAGTTLRIFWGSFWPYGGSAVAGWCWFFTGVTGAVLLGLLAASWKKKKTIVWSFCVLWLAVYGIFFWTWEPATECYRMTDLIPIALLLALGLKTWKNPLGHTITAGVLFAMLLPVNYVTRIGPMQDAKRNVVYQETLRLAGNTPSESLYLTSGGVPWIYLLYFEGRTAWNLVSFQRGPDRLSQEIQRYRSLSSPIYIREDAVQNGLFNPWKNTYPAESFDPTLPWLKLK